MLLKNPGVSLDEEILKKRRIFLRFFVFPIIDPVTFTFQGQGLTTRLLREFMKFTTLTWESILSKKLFIREFLLPVWSGIPGHLPDS